MMKKSIVKPLGDRILLEPLSEDERATKTATGIIIPDTAGKEKMDRGRVVEVGPGKINDAGHRVPPAVKKGQTVIFSEFSADKIKVGDKEYYIISESNILAVVE